MSPSQVYPILIGAALGGYSYGSLEYTVLGVAAVLIVMTCLKYLLD